MQVSFDEQGSRAEMLGERHRHISGHQGFALIGYAAGDLKALQFTLLVHVLQPRDKSTEFFRTQTIGIGERNQSRLGKNFDRNRASLRGLGRLRFEILCHRRFLSGPRQSRALFRPVLRSQVGGSYIWGKGFRRELFRFRFLRSHRLRHVGGGNIWGNDFRGKLLLLRFLRSHRLRHVGGGNIWGNDFRGKLLLLRFLRRHWLYHVGRRYIWGDDFRGKLLLLRCLRRHWLYHVGRGYIWGDDFRGKLLLLRFLRRHWLYHVGRR